MKIQLRKMPAIAPRGKNRGIFSGVTDQPAKNASGKECIELKVVVDLDAKGPDGKPFQVEKRYNLSGHGLRFFQDDFASWAGRHLTDEELDQFDPDVLMKGKPVVVDTDHKREGKKLVSIVQKFLPD